MKSTKNSAPNASRSVLRPSHDVLSGGELKPNANAPSKSAHAFLQNSVPNLGSSRIHKCTKSRRIENEIERLIVYMAKGMMNRAFSAKFKVVEFTRVPLRGCRQLLNRCTLLSILLSARRRP